MQYPVGKKSDRSAVLADAWRVLNHVHGNHQPFFIHAIQRCIQGDKSLRPETGERDALDSVSKDNFGDSQSTEWSIVMNQETKELIYYHRENYGRAYVVPVE